MRASWNCKNNSNDLIVFFSGWGVDKNPFQHLRDSASDVIFMDIYHSDLDPFQWDSLLKRYEKITVVAWSMGVLMAVQWLKKLKVEVDEVYAINGTCMPVDEQYGIDPFWFERTLELLDQKVLDQFYKRMCRKKEILTQFLANKPDRTLDSLKEELRFLYHLSMNSKNDRMERSTSFTKAVISTKDFVMPSKSQHAYWNHRGMETISLEAPHFIFAGFSCWSDLVKTFRDMRG